MAGICMQVGGKREVDRCEGDGGVDRETEGKQKRKLWGSRRGWGIARRQRTEKQRKAEKTDVWWGKKEPVNTPELWNTQPIPLTLPGSSASSSAHTKDLFSMMNKSVLSHTRSGCSAYFHTYKHTNIKYNQLDLVTALYRYVSKKTVALSSTF